MTDERLTMAQKRIRELAAQEPQPEEPAPLEVQVAELTERVDALESADERPAES